jgi:hypothetical protein
VSAVDTDRMVHGGDAAREVGGASTSPVGGPRGSACDLSRSHSLNRKRDVEAVECSLGAGAGVGCVGGVFTARRTSPINRLSRSCSGCGVDSERVDV